MDASSTAAAWLSVLVTAVGLGSLMTQTNTIREQLDPFRLSRSKEALGAWISCQPISPWYRLGKSTPRGPVINARLKDGLCGRNQIALSRLPLGITGTATWTICLSILHETMFGHRTRQKTGLFHREKPRDSYLVTIDGGTNVREPENFDSCEPHMRDLPESKKNSVSCWLSRPTQPLVRQGASTGLTIDRTTLMILLALCNASENFRYSDASGHRAAYSSYNGNWYLEWPLGGAAIVRFAPHESHSASTDAYPRMFQRRVDKCIQMMTGVVTGSANFRCAFTGRRSHGSWKLEHHQRGFSGARGSRHLYNMVGGNEYIHQTDYLYARRVEEPGPEACLRLVLPSVEKVSKVFMFVPEKEQSILAQSLDCLPWDSCSWSVHRGLRDILVAFAKPTMDRYRKSLASRLRWTVERYKGRLKAAGWGADFVDLTMADLAANAVMAGEGDSGDAVRVVTDIAALLWSSEPSSMDETTFWRTERDRSPHDQQEISPSTVIALTKCFILEWSNEFDYRMYDDLPTQLAFV